MSIVTLLGHHPDGVRSCRLLAIENRFANSKAATTKMANVTKRILQCRYTRNAFVGLAAFIARVINPLRRQRGGAAALMTKERDDVQEYPLCDRWTRCRRPDYPVCSRESFGDFRYRCGRSAGATAARGKGCIAGGAQRNAPEFALTSAGHQTSKMNLIW